MLTQNRLFALQSPLGSKWHNLPPKYFEAEYDRSTRLQGYNRQKKTPDRTGVNCRVLSSRKDRRFKTTKTIIIVSQ